MRWHDQECVISPELGQEPMTLPAWGFPLFAPVLLNPLPGIISMPHFSMKPDIFALSFYLFCTYDTNHISPTKLYTSSAFLSALHKSDNKVDL